MCLFPSRVLIAKSSSHDSDRYKRSLLTHTCPLVIRINSNDPDDLAVLHLVVELWSICNLL